MLKRSFNYFKTAQRINCLRFSTQLKYSYHNVIPWIPKFGKHQYSKEIILGFSILSLFGFEEKTHHAEDDIVMNLKWSILLIQRKEYDKAEQLLHLTLRIAQQLQNQDGVTYIYDVMANLALETGKFEKAEKLFVSVMQRLLAKGVATDDIKNVHISLKLARIYHLMGNMEKAGIGFRWSIENINKKIENDPLSEVNILLATAKDWYGHFMIDKGELQNASILLYEAYEILTLFEGDNQDQIVVLLNDMAFLSEKFNDLQTSEKYLKEAIKRGRKIDNMDDLGVMHVNLGRIYMKQRLYDKAQKYCGFALNLAVQRNDKETIEQADLCLKELKKL